MTLQDDMVNGCCAKAPIPFVVDCLNKECYCCSKPIDEPVWRYDNFVLHFGVSVYFSTWLLLIMFIYYDYYINSGLLKIGNKEYIPLAGHLSTKSCEKVHNLSKSLPCMVEVTKTPRSNVWPKRWDGSRSSNDNIGLYFFPIKMRCLI